MPDPLDFDRDIAPERNTFGLSSSEAKFLGEREDARLAPQLDLMMKLNNHLTQQRNSDFAHRAGMFELKQKKKDLRKKRKFDEKAKAATAGLTEIAHDDLTPHERAQELSLWAVDNAKTLDNNPALVGSYNALKDFNSAKLGEKQAKVAKKDKKLAAEQAKDPHGTIANLLNSRTYKPKDQEDVDNLIETMRDDDGELSQKDKPLAAALQQRFDEHETAETEATEAKTAAEKSAISASLDAKNKRANAVLDDLKEIVDEAAKEMAAEEEPEKKLGMLNELNKYKLPDGTALKGTPSQIKKQIYDYRQKLFKDMEEERDAALSAVGGSID
jgi:hypothetical protein